MRHLRPTHVLLILTVFCAALATDPVAAQEQTSADAIVNAENVEPPSVEYQSQLPPLIDRQIFFGDPQRSSAQISLDGEHVSFIKPYEGVMSVW
jgi:hypothetical protein